MKHFNTEAYCDPQLNYMVDVSRQASQIIQLIDSKQYFSINRPHQYGKTNMLLRLERLLQDRYYVISLDFQDVTEDRFASPSAFTNFIVYEIWKGMKEAGCPPRLLDIWLDSSLPRDDGSATSFVHLGERISKLCEASHRGIVLMIDEMDQSTHNEILCSFLEMLQRNHVPAQHGSASSFHSVILAGITDVWSLKESPWNIAPNFTVDMSFSAEEIAGMLQEYEADHHTGMDVIAASRELRRLTSGYPYLVSWLCKWLDTEGGMDWSVRGVQAAGRAFIRSDCSLLTCLQMSLENSPALKELFFKILYCGERIPLGPLSVPAVQLGVMHGYLAEDGKGCAKVANLLFEEFLYEYSAAVQRDSLMPNRPLSMSQFADGPHLNIVQILNRFQEHLASEYRSAGSAFLEQHGNLFFLSFLTPIISGAGHCHVEPQTRCCSRRKDVVITCGTEKHIVELKIWDSPKHRESGIRQLEAIMDSRRARKGYLVSFGANRAQRGWLSSDETSKQIYEVCIHCTEES